MTPTRATVFVAALAVSGLLAACAVQEASSRTVDELRIIPRPNAVAASTGPFRLQPGTRILVPDVDEVRWIGVWLADLLERTAMVGVRVTDEAAAHPSDFIRLHVGELPGSPGREAYRVEVAPGGVTVTANDVAGLFYGAVTVWQLATASTPVEGAISLPPVVIDDAPRFAWRGLMLDSARHYLPPPFIKNMIEWMALHKLNVLHWHLTDDQGWRLEIPGYPRLTEVGAWRVPAGRAAAQDLDPATGKPRLYGGYYTADEIRNLVAYAAKRQVAIVPEVDMPGHAQAAVAAYPELGAGAPPPGVSSDWGVHDYLFNVEEDTLAALENILAEVLELFPGRYIHVGGDEAVKTRWARSKRVQARMDELGIADEAGLQSWFIARMERFLAAHGRELIGWDEILEGGVAPEATVMSWRGLDGALEAASLGHDAVLTPWPTLYFDHRQSKLATEPPGRGLVISLEDVYRFDPMPAELAPGERPHVLGVQANLWSEHIRTEERLAYMAFPRAAALAEVAWTAPERLDWKGFVRRLPEQFGRYRLLDMPFATSAFDTGATAARVGRGLVQVELANQAGAGVIRYTLDGTPVTAGSSRYAGPLELEDDARLAAATFLDGRQVSRELRAVAGHLADIRSSHQLELCTENLVLSLEDDAPLAGPRRVFLVDIMNPCWLWPDVDLSAVSGIEATVGQVPFNFQLGADREKIVLAPPRTAAGELEVRANGCDGDAIAVLPLQQAAQEHGVTVLARELPGRSNGSTDLCFRFTAAELDPLWVIDRIALQREAAHGQPAVP